MKNRASGMADVSMLVHVLRHIETSEYVCLRQNGKEYLAAFTSGDAAIQFREELGMIEFVDLHAMRLGDAPFEQFWLDGEMVGRSLLADRPARLGGN